MKIGIRPLITLHFFLASVALTTYSLIIGKQRIEKREAGEDVVYITVCSRVPLINFPYRMECVRSFSQLIGLKQFG